MQWTKSLQNPLKLFYKIFIPKPPGLHLWWRLLIHPGPKDILWCIVWHISSQDASKNSTIQDRIYWPIHHNVCSILPSVFMLETICRYYESPYLSYVYFCLLVQELLNWSKPFSPNRPEKKEKKKKKKREKKNIYIYIYINIYTQIYKLRQNKNWEYFL